MQRIKTTIENKDTVTTLTKNKFQFKDDRIIAQIALAYSIQKGSKFELSDWDVKNKGGKEYPESVLGSLNGNSNDIIYHVILNHHYGRKISKEDFPKLVKLHLDHGLEMLNKDLILKDKGKGHHINYLMNLINNGLGLISNQKISTISQKEKNKVKAYEGILEIELGKNKNNGENISIHINDENHFDSQHFAVAGMNGSGKTELIKDILMQMTKQSSGELKFIFFDYKGEGESDKLKTFLESTSCEFLNVAESPLKFNPLTRIDAEDERKRHMDIMSFRDTFSTIDKKLGQVQKNNLMQVIESSFNQNKRDFPSINDVNQELQRFYEDNGLRHDSLTAIFDDIASIVFDDDFDPDFSFLDQSLYINLPPSLPDVARKASVFLILDYLLNYFINTNDVKPSEDRIKPIRYVIVIDEAHAYLKEKNMAGVLENLLRMIRSKGVIIMMLSQGIEEYKQKTFDFSSQIKIPIMLNVQNKNIKTVKSFIGTPRSDRPLQDALNELEGGLGIVNFTEPKLIEINQFWKRK